MLSIRQGACSAQKCTFRGRRVRQPLYPDRKGSVNVNSDAEFARSTTGARTVVAAFGDPDTARQAAKRLRAEGFHKTWIGVTSADDTLRSADDSAGAKLGR